MDGALALDLIAEAAAAATPHAQDVLDIGCGAGNYTLKLMQRLPGLRATLLDLSRPMLDRAAQRVSASGAGRVETIQEDVRAAEFGEGRFDVILAAAVLHHLRGEDDWRAVFAKFRRCLRPGGSLWIYDLVTHEDPAVHAAMWRRYAEYLEGLKGPAYRETVFAYIEKEDSPRPVTWQIERLREAGFASADVLHKNGPFAAFGARV
ncbi:MAG: class I SAM-dependent methyltransferase [Planctomycetota bacterium]|nr:class I SAM-dependent methyltransferase [Planctomycetota bacterium]